MLALESILAHGGDVAWEWPTSAAAGWRSRAIGKLEKLFRRYGKGVYYARIEGCAYGLEWQGLPVRKRWTILTSSQALYTTLCRRCPGPEAHPEHAECRGLCAQASAYYPSKMCADTLKAFQHQWIQEDHGLVRDTEIHLLGVPPSDAQELTAGETVLALSRTRLEPNAPTGRRLEAVKSAMMRVHRASGHSGFSNLRRLLEARQAPKWAQDLAMTLQCPECTEASKPRPAPPASLGAEPALFEIVGTDIFEWEDDDEKTKYKVALWRDRASGLTFLDVLQSFSSRETWEPKSVDMIESFCRWLSRYPAPTWVATDAARYFSSVEFLEFCGRSGIGHTVAPAEAHWLMGSEESAINLVRQTMGRLRKEFMKYKVVTLFDLVAHAMNSHVGASGFSAYQWVHGQDFFSDPPAPPGLDPSKAMAGLLKARDRARLCYEKEKAKDKYSKLANATGRPPVRVRAGQLCMLWRQKVKPGKMKGSWIGPLRVVLIEGSTIWMASGATLIRAKPNQVRAASKREELQALTEGTAILRTPVNLETLLKGFKGRYYLDVSGDVPSDRQVTSDLTASEVTVEPQPHAVRGDTWRLEQKDGVRVLTRIHNLPRLGLYAPTSSTPCPVPLEEFTGKRTTTVRPLMDGAEPMVVEDTWDVQRSLQDRWVGQTTFELVNVAKPAKVPRATTPKGIKRKAEDTEKETEEATQPAGVLIPRTSLQQALDRDPALLDGYRPHEAAPSGAAGSMDCSAAGCELPGGHAGPHQGADGRFLVDETTGARYMVDTDQEDDTISSSSSSAFSDRELVPDGDHAYFVKKTKVTTYRGRARQPEVFYAMEIDMDEQDARWLARHPRKAAVWLSKKMEAKSTEESWNQLSLERKKDFDIAQAKELSQVMTSGALRSLTRSEQLNLDKSKVMNMRWVLTTKSGGVAKARLVVLGFQAHNLTEVETASPTMSKIGRNMVLMLAANLGFELKSGDVSSAFLQADAVLEDENLAVWAPPELATLFGGDPRHPMALRVVRAFYGLCHAPRKWFESVVASLKKHGWRQMLGDRCIFTLEDPQTGSLVGLSGFHVDDFLISGEPASSYYIEAEKKLQTEYRFGKWDSAADGFEFAGCYIQQLPDKSIKLDQESYVTKWLDEMTLDKKKGEKEALTPSEISMLRGSLGTISWRATQSGPQYVADTSLLLSETNKATQGTLVRTNKLIREMRRNAGQGLLFPSWRRPLSELSVITWADASNHNRPDKASSVGIITGVSPISFLSGDELQVAVVHWKSGKTPRQCLGSNGAEVQAITMGEDQNFQIRALLAEMSGSVFKRDTILDEVKKVAGALVMDSRGIFDAMTRNMSALHGLRESQAGYELTLAVNQALRVGTRLRWVNGLAQLADSLTKADNRKTLLQFLAQKQHWRLIHDEKFTAGRKLHKRELERKMKEDEQYFVGQLKALATKNHWPWLEPNEAPEPLLG